MNSLIVKLMVGGFVAVASIAGISRTLVADKASATTKEAPAVTMTAPVVQETAVPAQLQKRIDAMAAAMQAGDAKAYAANYNMDYLYSLIKGQVQYDANLFGGSAEDAARLGQNLGGIASPEALAETFAQSVNLDSIAQVTVTDVELSQDGRHATARLVQTKAGNGKVITSPQWHYFDNNWWQVDD